MVRHPHRREPHPATPVNWRWVRSSNVAAVGWDKDRNMYIRFNGSGGVYMYKNVSRQRAVYCAVCAPSCGRYVNLVIKKKFEAVKIA